MTEGVLDTTEGVGQAASRANALRAAAVVWTAAVSASK